MSKELEVLDDIQFKLKENCKNNQEYIWLCEKTNLIESGLKRLEKYDALNLSPEELKSISNLLKDLHNSIRKLTAFEIIKENLYLYDDSEYNDTLTITLVLNKPTANERDLLKEELL